MKVKGREFLLRIDPETSERLLHVEDYHDVNDAQRGTELTFWFGKNVFSLCLRFIVLLFLIAFALIGIFRGQFDKYCEAQKLR